MIRRPGKLTALALFLAAALPLRAGPASQPVCVLYFRNVTEHPAEREDAAWIGKLLADLLVTDLADARPVVMREVLESLLAERSLQGSPLFEEQGQALAGTLKAGLVIGGSYSLAGGANLAIVAWVMKPESGQILKTCEAHGPVTDLLRLSHELAVALLSSMGEPAARADTMILARTGRVSVDSLRAFSTGLDAYDAGDYPRAIAFFRMAAGAPLPLGKAAYHAGKCLADMGEHELAVIELKRSLDARPDDAWARDTRWLLVRCLHRLCGRTDLAREEAEALCASLEGTHLPLAPLAQWELGQILAAGKDPAAAWRRFDRGLGMMYRKMSMSGTAMFRENHPTAAWNHVQAHLVYARYMMLLNLWKALDRGETNVPTAAPRCWAAKASELGPLFRTLSTQQPVCTFGRLDRGACLDGYVQAPPGQVITSASCQATFLASRSNAPGLTIEFWEPPEPNGWPLGWVGGDSLSDAPLSGSVDFAPGRSLIRLRLNPFGADLLSLRVEFGLAPGRDTQTWYRTAIPAGPPDIPDISALESIRDLQTRANRIRMIQDQRDAYHIVFSRQGEYRTAGSIGLLSSPDGARWNKTANLSVNSLGLDTSPSLAEREDGTLVLAWQSDRRVTGIHEIWLAHSQDAVRWSWPRRFLTAPGPNDQASGQGAFSLHPLLFAAREGGLALVFSTYEAELAVCQSDSGERWMTPSVITKYRPGTPPHGTNMIYTWMTPDNGCSLPDGRIAVVTPAYHYREKDQVLLAVPDSAGTAKLTPLGLGGSSLPPRIACDRTGLFWALSKNRLDGGLYVSCSRDAAQWTRPAPCLIGHDRIEDMALVAARDGQLAIAWIADVQGSRIFFSRIPKTFANSVRTRLRP